jgi:hypothetical protein
VQLQFCSTLSYTLYLHYTSNFIKRSIGPTMGPKSLIQMESTS